MPSEPFGSAPARERAMEHKTKKAILVVSFGTTFHRTREKTIDKIEEEIQAAYPEYELYRAWTSKMIIAKLLRRDGIRVPTVTEAVEAMLADGITELVVQPTHIINGVENDQMKADVQEYRDRFLRVVFGNPLLTTTEDSQEAIQAVMAEFPELDTKDALVFMGHGTTHYANTVYAALDYTFKDLGYPHVFLGTVEAYPSLESLMKMVQSFAPRRVLLAPFMVVAGDHAIHDMSGEDQDSWRSQFEKAGFKVECFMKGLGEYAGIRRMYVQHVADALAGDAGSQQTI